jgi:hypothetical protein
VEMRRRMIVPIHGNDDAEELADDRHITYFVVKAEITAG